MHYLLFLFFLPFLDGSELPFLNDSDYVQSIHVIHGEWIETENDLSCGSLELKRIFQPQARHAYSFAEGWHFNLPDLLEQEIPRKKAIHSPQDQYHFLYDDAHRLIRLEKCGGSAESIMIEHDPENGSLTARTSEGDAVHYEFEGPYLSRVKKEGGGEVSYRYGKHPYERRPLITEKSIAGSETLFMEYWELPEEDRHQPLHSIRWGKIKTLTRLSHADGQKEMVCTLDYSQDSTSVLYGTGVRVLYRFNGLKQITAIETHWDDRLYRTQEIEWNGNLVSSKTTKDGTGALLLKESFLYDNRSLLIEETLFGILTGQSSTPETYKKRYFYDDAGHLLRTEEESGLVTAFTYDPQTALPLTKEIREGHQLLLTARYRYDPQNKLAEEIEDDGQSRIAFTEILERNERGAPLAEASGFCRRSTLEKIICRYTHYEYDGQGREISKRLLYPDGEEISKAEKSFDPLGRLIEERANGETRSYLYTQDGHLLSCTFKNSLEEKETVYDPMGKPLIETVRSPGKIDRTTRYFYDSHQRLIELQSASGLRKSFSYDPLGRKTAETIQLWDQPPSTSRYTYDAMDHLIGMEDDQGCYTQSTYNARGQPLTVSYPDGTEEQFRYTPDGRIIYTKGRDGIQKQAVRDLFDRLTCESICSLSGAPLEENHYRYNGYELIEESSSKGTCSHYEFDERGRKILEQIEPSGIHMEYRYDDKDQLIAKREYLIETVLDSVIDPQSGKWELYDLSGKKLLRQPDEAHNELSIEETLQPLSSGQLAICQISRDSQGVSLLKFLDPLERVVCEEKRAPDGKLLQKQSFTYDSQGRMSCQTISLVFQGKETGTIRNRWRIGPCGRLEEVIEKEGSAAQESTSYTYDDYGRLSEIIKPDGTRLTHLYDDAGRLLQFTASDRSVDYLMQYDPAGRLTAAINLATGQATSRQYTEKGQVASEVLENGLKIAFDYDVLGRKRAVILPDHSSIEYRFSSLFMDEVVRKDRGGKVSYLHRYTAYDLRGNPIEQEMIGNLGTIQLDAKDHSKQLKTPFYQEMISFDSQGRVSSRTIDEGPPVHYQYDFLNQLTAEQGASPVEHDYESTGQPRLEAVVLKHDLNGNLIEKIEQGICYRYRYDALNRMIAASKEGLETFSCSYDAFHRRIQTFSSGCRNMYLYDGNREIGAFSEEHEPLELRILGKCQESELHAAVAIELKGIAYAPIHDLSGSISLLVDFDKKIVSRTSFQPFGPSHSDDQSLQSPWGYSGKRCDRETGLIYYGRRYYDPSCKQWTSKDPLGFADGANRHLFANNNPLSFKDHFGLTATQESFPALKERVLEQLKSLGAKILHAIRYVKRHANMDLTTTLDNLIGRGFLLLLGYYKTNPHKGVYGKGEVSDKVRVSFINGILTDYASLYTTLQTLSTTHGGVNIHYIYRPTKGWVYDILHSFLVKLGYVSSQAKTLAQEWKTMIEEMGGVEGGGMIIHYAHSIGTVESLRALSLLTPEEQKMIKIYAFGSPNLSDPGGNAEITHFVSVRDGVSLLDPIGFINACRGKIENVLFVGTFWGIPLIDHLFSTQCYQDIWSSMGRTFVEWYGSLL